jgi:hypothetical protein
MEYAIGFVVLVIGVLVYRHYVRRGSEVETTMYEDASVAECCEKEVTPEPVMVKAKTAKKAAKKTTKKSK